LEVTASWDAANALGQAAIDIPLSLTYTFTDAEFQTGFSSDYGPWGNVEAGDELPYVAHHQMTLGAGIVSNRWSLNTSASYVGEARATAGHGSIAASDTIDSRWVVDMSASYEVAGNIFLKAKAENLFDEVYIAARRPSGVRPGKPQEFLVGVEVKF
jgi:Fe(3+) dicitrate transport protein